MQYALHDIAAIFGLDPKVSSTNPIIENLLTDSRKLVSPESTLFFTIHGPNRSANTFISSLYQQGVRAFVVDDTFQQSSDFPGATFLKVENVMDALQKLVQHHRRHFNIPVIGITGSNGKTIVKEWLDYLLSDYHTIVKSPKSFNSQIGVPLSVWQMNEQHQLGIFEAGISQPGEMQRLQQMILPEIVVITNIGEAHAAGFESADQKIEDKLQLAKNAKILIVPYSDKVLLQHAQNFISNYSQLKLITWGFEEQADHYVSAIEKTGRVTHLQGSFNGKNYSIQVPFTDTASIHNALTCVTVLMQIGISIDELKEKFLHLPVVEMRLELKMGINNCSIINDSYINDLSSLIAALEFMKQQHQHSRYTVILSDLSQLRKDATTTYRFISNLMSKYQVHRLIGVGSDIYEHQELFQKVQEVHFFKDTDSLIRMLPSISFQNETILLKGARVYGFEKILHRLTYQTHDAVFEINLSAMRQNLRLYQQQLRGTKLMAMVKAFSYGVGSFEVANLLEHSQVDYLAVAYPDEGVSLRRNGIRLPIMVMNTEEEGFDNMVKYQLEPEIFSFRIAKSFIQYLEGLDIYNYPIHLKFDTGMHRLGFEEHDMTALIGLLKQSPQVKIVSAFTHLVASEDEESDDFTLHQADMFKRMCDSVHDALGYSFIRHVSNSSAIVRLPQLRFDMVRLGIGLYGIENGLAELKGKLTQVGTLRTTISQIRKVKKGDTVGYNRRGKVERDSFIATIRIGYADGYPRALSNGKGSVWINGKLAPVIGNICMDMTMIDVTGMDVREGDHVIVFGPMYSVEEVAKNANTIAYEILAGISQRIKRVYYDE